MGGGDPQKPIKCKRTENKLDEKDHQSRQQKQTEGQLESEQQQQQKQKTKIQLLTVF